MTDQVRGEGLNSIPRLYKSHVLDGTMDDSAILPDRMRPIW